MTCFVLLKVPIRFKSTIAFGKPFSAPHTAKLTGGAELYLHRILRVLLFLHALTVVVNTAHEKAIDYVRSFSIVKFIGYVL